MTQELLIKPSFLLNFKTSDNGCKPLFLPSPSSDGQLHLHFYQCRPGSGHECTTTCSAMYSPHRKSLPQYSVIHLKPLNHKLSYLQEVKNNNNNLTPTHSRQLQHLTQQYITVSLDVHLHLPLVR